MIDRDHDLSLTRQAEILALSRGSLYYDAKPVCAADLDLMREIDHLHLDYPFAGARMLRDMLKRKGYGVLGRRHVARLMRLMGIEALYRKKRTTKRNPDHPVFCVPAAPPGHRAPESRLGGGHLLHPHASRVLVSLRRSGLGNASYPGVAAFQHAHDGLLHRSGAGSHRTARMS
jgi:hypothetical protein